MNQSLENYKTRQGVAGRVNYKDKSAIFYWWAQVKKFYSLNTPRIAAPGKPQGYKLELDMLDFLKSTKKPNPSSKELMQREIIAQVGRSLKEHDEDALTEALKKLELPLRRGPVEKLMRQAIGSNWPTGFDKVLGHLNLSTTMAYSFDGYDKRPMLSVLMSVNAYELMKHIWKRSSEEERLHCLDALGERGSLGLARVLIEVGEGSKIRHGGRSPPSERDLKALLSSAVNVMDQVEIKEEVIACEASVVKEILSCNSDSLKKAFWEALILTDNMPLIRALSNLGALRHEDFSIDGRLVQMVCSMANGKGQKILDEDEEDAETNADVALRTFNFAEIVCLYSEGELKILGECILDKGFRQSMMDSALSKSLLVLLASQGEAGVEILSELKAQGVSVENLKGKNGKNLLHLLATAFTDNSAHSSAEGAQRAKNVMELCPEWIVQKDKDGRVPSECVYDRHAREKFIALTEAVALGAAIKKAQPIKVLSVDSPTFVGPRI